jgi:hypothetical protein
MTDKKRGRKKLEETTPIPSDPVEAPPTADPKKRGRKPKCSKIVVKPFEAVATPAAANVILHLKCTMKDIVDVSVAEYVEDLLPSEPLPGEVATNIKLVSGNIVSYNEYDKNLFVYDPNDVLSDILTTPVSTIPQNYAYMDTLCKKCKTSISNTVNPPPGGAETGEEYDDLSMKDINSKLKQLRIQLFKNAMCDKVSACFWCTYEFDNPACFIPKYEMDDSIHGYGSFCRPECAVAYLMKENLDDSTKFERYHMLNQMYGKIYGFKKSIKPAPNPYYMLDKFYGTLNIHEYRRLLKTDNLLTVIDKPMTRILPELHEDNDEFVLSLYSNSKTQNQQTGMYKVKKASEKPSGPSKNSIIKNNFGIAVN